jgi:site-specific recombinase XerD
VRDLLGRVSNPIHKACFMVMYACGLRISEAVMLQVTAIDKINMVVRVIGKGNTERRVTLPQPVLTQTVAYPPQPSMGVSQSPPYGAARS